jgi:signal transduction histidine kinase
MPSSYYKVMKTHLILILLLIVAVPMLALGWMGSKMLDSEQGMVQYQFKKTLAQRLQDVDSGINEELNELRSRLNKELDFTATRQKEITEFVENHPFIQQVIIFDKDKSLIYPLTGLTSEDELFVEVFEDIVSEDKIQISGNGNNQGRFSSTDDWSVWFHDQGLSLIFWRFDRQGNLVIARLKRDALLSYITLKVSNYTDEYPGERMSLANELGAEFYSWGDLEFEIKSLTPQATMPLSFPLGTFQLRYYTVSFPGLKRNLQFQLFLQLGAVAFILLFLGLYILDAMQQAGRKLTFVNQVSHELKTPLTNIRMYAELLENALADEDSSTVNKLNIIKAESQRLSRLINNVLTFSHSDAVKIKKERHNIDKLIGKVIESLKPGLEQAGIEIKLDLNAGFYEFDKDTIEQALINLVNNVEKYASSGKYLEITSWKEQGRLHIIVRDRGPGIPLKLKEQIFKPFFRVHNSITEGVSGAGIGLSLARELVEKNGGELNLVDNKEGACFEVII